MSLLDLPLDTLAGSVLAFSLKGTLLLTLALGAALALRRAPAAARHAVWVTALAALLVLPAASVVLPAWEVAVAPAAPALLAPLAQGPPPAAPAARAVAEPAGTEGAAHSAPQDRAPVASALGAAASASEAGSPTGLRERAETLVLTATATARAYAAGVLDRVVAHGWRIAGLVWLLGMGALVLRWGGALVGAFRIVQEAEPVRDPAWCHAAQDAARAQGVRGEVRLLRSQHLAVPVAWTVGPAAVVLPADADAWDADRRRVVLAHEMAHVARRDGMSQLVAQAAVLVHWFNPLAWLAYHRVLQEREQACDDRVLLRGARPSDYAQHLVELARRYRPEPLSVLALAPMARPTGLEARVRAILDPAHRPARASRQALAGIAALALLLVGPLAAFQPAPPAPAPIPAPLAPAPPPAPLPPPAPPAPEAEASVSDWTWSGVVRSGGTVEVFGVNGNVSAGRASGNRVEASAERRMGRPARGSVEDVEIVVREHSGGVTICAVWPGQRGCEPGRGPSGGIENSNVSVNFRIRVPDGVGFAGKTTNGNVEAEGMSAPVTVRTTNGNVRAETQRGDVEAHTTNGNVTARAGGVVRAGTTNGNVTAHFGQADWSGALRIATTNGNVSVVLPDGADVDIRARTGTGSIRSALPITVRRTGYVGAEAEGQVGRGGRRLDLGAQNGTIRIERAGARTGAHYQAPAHAAEVAAAGRAEASAARVHAARVSEDAHAIAELATEASLGALAAIDWEGIGALVGEATKTALASVDWEEIRAEVSAGLAEAREELRAARLEQEQALREVRQDRSLSAAERVRIEEDAARALREAERGLREAERALREVERAPRP